MRHLLKNVKEIEKLLEARWKRSWSLRIKVANKKNELESEGKAKSKLSLYTPCLLHKRIIFC